MTKYNEVYLSFLEHELLIEKYDVDINSIPKKLISDPTSIKIVDTLNMLVRLVEFEKGKTNKEIISIISKSLNI
jgi:hypothetical protein